MVFCVFIYNKEFHEKFKEKDDKLKKLLDEEAMISSKFIQKRESLKLSIEKKFEVKRINLKQAQIERREQKELDLDINKKVSYLLVKNSFYTLTLYALIYLL